MLTLACRTTYGCILPVCVHVPVVIIVGYIMEHFELASASVSFADGLISMHIRFPCLVAIREILSHACWELD